MKKLSALAAVCGFAVAIAACGDKETEEVTFASPGVRPKTSASTSYDTTVLSKKGGQPISRNEGEVLIKRYQDAKINPVNGVRFSTSVLKELCAIQGAEEIMFSFAQYESGALTLVLQPVDGAGKIITSNPAAVRLKSTAKTNGVDGTVVNVGNPCPPYCPTTD